jgi:hypothetical protein
MLSQTTIEHTRKLSPDVKWRTMFDAIDAAWKHMSSLPREEAERRIEYLRKRHDASNRRMLDRMRELG